MSHSRCLVASMATFAMLLAVPAIASATTSSASPVAGVQTHVVKAQAAIERMNRAANAGNTAGVVRQLRAARTQTAAASRKARGIAAGSDSVAAAQALTLAGTAYEQLIASMTQLVDQVTGRAQALLAQAIKPSLAGQQRIIGVLRSLLDDVPASIQPILASIVTGLAVGDADEVANMDAAIRSGALPASIAPIVKQALGMATRFIDMAFSAIKGIVPLLPAAAQAPMTQILDMVTRTVGTLVPSMLSTATGLVDTILASLPFARGAGGGGLTSIFGGLLGDVTGGGQGALPGNTGDMLSKLLSTIFGGGSTSGAGGMGDIISSIMDLINKLLSGMFGGHHGLAPAA